MEFSSLSPKSRLPMTFPDFPSTNLSFPSFVPTPKRSELLKLTRQVGLKSRLCFAFILLSTT